MDSKANQRFFENKFFHSGLFLFYGVLTLILYAPTAGAGLVTDAQNWLIQYDKQGSAGIIHSFGDNALHQLYHFAFFSAYKILGLQAWGWLILFCMLHALNAFLIYITFKKYFAFTGINKGSYIAFAASFLFLISPYQTEVVVWWATIHYLIVTALSLNIVVFTIDYLKTGRKKTLWLIFVLFTFSLFTLEIALCIPLLLFILFQFTDVFELVSRKKFLAKLISPMLAACTLYFVLNKIILGEWVGHYGPSEHLKFSVGLITDHFNKYLLKLSVFLSFIPSGFQSKILTLISKNFIIDITAGIYILLLAVLIIYYHRINSKFKMILIFFFATGIALLPVLNLYFTTIHPIEGDRLSYFACIFFFLALSVLCIQVLKFSGIIILFLFAGLSVFFLQKNIHNWHRASSVEQSLQNDFHWQNSERVFLLNVPENYHGAYMYRDNGTGCKLKDALTLKNKEHVPAEIIDVLQYNMNSNQDFVTVEIMDSVTLKVTFGQWGNWWWLGGIGASDYQTDLFKIDIDDWSHAYTVQFLNKKPDDIFLYQSGEKWQELKGF